MRSDERNPYLQQAFSPAEAGSSGKSSVDAETRSVAGSAPATPRVPPARRVCFVAGVLLLAALAAMPLYAQPGNTSINSFDDTELGFAYIPDQDFEITGSIDIVQRGDEDRDFFITISGGQSGDVDARAAINPNDPADSVEYELQNPSSAEVLRDFSDGTPSSTEVLSGVLPGADSGPWRTTVSVDILLVVEEGQLENPDPQYEDDLDMNLYYGDIDDPTSYTQGNPEASATLQVRGNVDPFVELAVVDPGTGFPPGRFGDNPETERNMDFGTLEPGDVQAYDLLVRSNTLFTIEVESRDGGVLTYQGGDATTTELPTEVPYEFRIDGQQVGLGSGATVFGSGLSGFRWPLETQILDFGVPVAGEYEDIIELTVSADQ